eukprot:1177551-Prorocentrum_minimum.AAC.2
MPYRHHVVPPQGLVALAALPRHAGWWYIPSDLVRLARDDLTCTGARPVKVNIPICVTMWSQLPGVPSLRISACSADRIRMMRSAIPFTSAWGCDTYVTLQSEARLGDVTHT